jgi:hypothetical protein
MCEDICIGVTEKAHLPWDRDPADDERAAGADPMNVPALPDPEIQRRAVS